MLVWRVLATQGDSKEGSGKGEVGVCIRAMQMSRNASFIYSPNIPLKTVGLSTTSADGPAKPKRAWLVGIDSFNLREDLIL